MSTEEVRKKIQAAVPHMPHGERIRRIALFGSHLHGNATGDSDIDLLIEVSRPFTLFQLVELQEALAHALGKEVDLVTPEFLSQYFRSDVLREASTLYEKR
jgi:predicted nucleotidyltransferase